MWGRLQIATADEEQAWNAEQLAALVDKPQFRVWLYRSPAVVLGSAQHARNYRNRSEYGMAIVKRSAGGGAVPVGPWLVGVSVALPIGHPLVSASVVKSYRWFGSVHAKALRLLGIHATAIPPDLIRSPRASGPVLNLRWACFGSLSPWEVVGHHDRKLVGLAQVRRRTGVLLVGGTLISAPDWVSFAALMGHPPAAADELSRSTTTCESELQRPVSSIVFATTLCEELARCLN